MKRTLKGTYAAEFIHHPGSHLPGERYLSALNRPERGDQVCRRDIFQEVTARPQSDCREEEIITGVHREDDHLHFRQIRYDRAHDLEAAAIREVCIQEDEVRLRADQ